MVFMIFGQNSTYNKMDISWSSIHADHNGASPSFILHS